MNTLLSRPKGNSLATPAGKQGMDWKAFFKRTIVIVFLFSLAIHLLLLIGFGGMTLFKGRAAKMPFTAQQIAADKVIEATPPPMEEPAPQESTTADPLNQEEAASSSEDAAPPLEMMTVPGGASWAPAIPRDAKTSPTGMIGGTGTGTGTGTGKGTGKGGGMGSGIKLFGVEVKAKKLGVVVSINKGAQSSGRLPGIFEEIFKLFPDSPVFLTNGGGMMDWDKALDAFNKTVEENKLKEKETGKKIFYPKNMEKPKVARFNSGEALDWVAVRGNNFIPDYPGLKEKHPELFNDLRRRSNVWFITSYKDANASYLAFDELIKKGVEAIYWYNSFDSPIEGKESEKIAQQITDAKIEILIQSQGGKTSGQEWLTKVDAKFVK